MAGVEATIARELGFDPPQMEERDGGSNPDVRSVLGLISTTTTHGVAGDLDYGGGSQNQGLPLPPPSSIETNLRSFYFCDFHFFNFLNF
ncbi:hypothetical protein CRG98_050061 [Punica granatum]|uniref:Uncharacterized protein n=1 Tax=Punica granatum TaxID=22663 RepID=A0A2I0GTA5_PUNGR|nr:hypothetical protein CRG98_050061 [Punica granatum]